MEREIWELRFMDGRGASYFTTVDVTEDIGRPGVGRSIPVAARVVQGNAVRDAAACFAEGRVVELQANMAAVAYAVRHPVSASES
jgi:hypothetical protein